MIGDVHYGKADLAIGELSMNYQRNQLVDFSTPCFVEPITFLSRNIHTSSQYGLFTFFVNNSWISYWIISTILFSIIIPKLIQLVYKKTKLYAENDSMQVISISNMGNNLAIILEAFLMKPHSSSFMARLRHHESVLSMFWRFFSMIYLIFYSTFILTSLIKDANSIESIEELRIAVNEGRVRIRYRNVGTSMGALLEVKTLCSFYG
jgi:hypothetical protein